MRKVIVQDMTNTRFSKKKNQPKTSAVDQCIDDDDNRTSQKGRVGTARGRVVGGNHRGRARRGGVGTAMVGARGGRGGSVGGSLGTGGTEIDAEGGSQLESREGGYSTERNTTIGRGMRRGGGKRGGGAEGK